MPTFESTARGYVNLWRRMEILPEKRAAVQQIARRLIANRPRYEAVRAGTGVPWHWIAVTHQMESGGNFKTHLHNGDPLSRRTTHVPAGRPLAGSPPFAWEQSAKDALQLKRLDRITEWSIPRMLYEFERYNGWGYLSKGINTPYLWSYSTLYGRGKYVADGKYDAKAVSSQCGAAVLLNTLLDLGALGATPAMPTFDVSPPITPPLPAKRPRQNFLLDLFNLLANLWRKTA
jgi:lysozyme family protein